MSGEGPGSHFVFDGAAVALQRFKHGGARHYRHHGTVLGSDQLGVWLAVPPQPLTRNGEFVLDVSWWTLQLVPATDEGWWAAFFEEGAGNYDLYVDVCVDSGWSGTTAVMTDLDLDVVRYRADGSVEIIDYDDLERHAALLDYPAELIDFAHETADALQDSIQLGSCPFDGSAEPWIERLRGHRRSSEQRR